MVGLDYMLLAQRLADCLRITGVLPLKVGAAVGAALEELGFPHIAARLREEKDKPSATTGLGLEDNTGRS